MLKTPLPATKQPDTDTDKFFSYLVNHVTRPTDNQPIATISPEQSARKTWTTAQIALFVVLMAATVLCLFFTGIATLTFLFGLITLLYVLLMGLAVAWIIAVSRAKTETPFDDSVIDDLKKAPWPAYTILCPLYHEKAVVPQFVNAMKALDYPADCLQVLFLTEEDDTETRAALGMMNLPAGYEALTVPAGTPRTKPRACNYGLQFATGEYVVIYDAEDIPDPLQLKKAVLTFASSPVDVACVQARLNFYNASQNLLTRWGCAEYSLWFDLILPGLQRLGFSLPLGGTSNHFRISALKALGGWDAFNVTEDCDLGLRLTRYGMKTIMLDSTTYEEANSRMFSWIRQRSRWIKGYMQTYLVHTRHPLKAVRQGKIKDLLSLHLFVGAGSIVLLVNPVMWAMFAVYLVWRPVDLYHQLFPWPVLYAGMLCFLVGNFLPVYVSMIACVRREEYSLVKYCLLLPLYWILASIAAFLAGYELVFKPHYWHKTQHGLHLKHKESTQQIAAISAKVATVSGVSKVGNVTASVQAMSTVLMPAVLKERLRRSMKWDPWAWSIVGLAVVSSICATVYYFNAHEILAYGDAYFHLRIARRLLDSATPGIGQLGTTWLPLPHLLMFPFAQNDYLWRTGLAGSFPSMACYVVAALYLFLSARRLTGNDIISFCGSLIFLFNPNVLYLQSTPLTELLCIATLTSACYYFLVWIQENRLSSLVLSAACIFLTTAARYDGWALFGILGVLLPLVCLVKRLKLKQVEGILCVFFALSSLGIILWLAYNAAFMGSPLYFEQGPYSSKAQTIGGNSHTTLFGYHNLWQSIHLYAVTVSSTVGSILSMIAIIAFALFLVRRRLDPEFFGVLAYLAPFAFYVLALYTGDVGLLVPGAVPANIPAHSQLFNDRFGSEMVVPISIFIILMVARLYPHVCHLLKSKQVHRYFSLTLSLGFVLVILAQSYIVSNTGIISLEDGLYGVSCEPTHLVNVYLARHYAGGRILEELFSSPVDGTEANFDFKNLIWEGSYQLWDKALAHPYSTVDWIITNPTDHNDVVARHMNINGTQFKSHFQLMVTEPSGLRLYKKKGVAIIPSRFIPSYVWNDLFVQRQQCDGVSYIK